MSKFWMVLLALVTAPVQALAAFSAITATGAENLIGVATDGSETGIYEIEEVVTAGLTVGITIVLLVMGFRIAKKAIKMAARS